MVLYFFGVFLHCSVICSPMWISTIPSMFALVDDCVNASNGHWSICGYFSISRCESCILHSYDSFLFVLQCIACDV